MSCIYCKGVVKSEQAINEVEEALHMVDQVSCHFSKGVVKLEEATNEGPLHRVDHVGS